MPPPAPPVVESVSLLMVLVSHAERQKFRGASIEDVTAPQDSQRQDCTTQHQATRERRRRPLIAVDDCSEAK